MVTSRAFRPRLLILSFDAINIDPRVIKQVHRFANEYAVTTCSPGPSPDSRVTHLEIDAARARPHGRWGNFINDFAREREWFGWLYRQLPLVQQAGERLKGHRFDAVIANDAETIGAAITAAGAQRVHADLHEFYPGLPVDASKLGARQRRYWTWLIRHFASQVASSTTVGSEIARRYAEYGVYNTGVVTNATSFREYEPTPTPKTIRLVHSGNPFKERGLADIMRAVARSRGDVTLDLYLTYNPPADREDLQALAAELGPRIAIHEPVSQAELIDTLHEYDVGIHVLPPTSENNALALPNKFFDFVQARLGIVVGPSIEMAAIVRDRHLGVVTEGFDEDSIRATLDALTQHQVDRFKTAVHQHASELSAEKQVEAWGAVVRKIVSGNQVKG